MILEAATSRAWLDGHQQVFVVAQPREAIGGILVRSMI